MLIGEHLQEKLVEMRLRGTPIGTSAVIGFGLGILKKHQSKSDCTIKLNKEWARSVLQCMELGTGLLCPKFYLLCF